MTQYCWYRKDFERLHINALLRNHFWIFRRFWFYFFQLLSFLQQWFRINPEMPNKYLNLERLFWLSGFLGYFVRKGTN